MTSAQDKYASPEAFAAHLATLDELAARREAREAVARLVGLSTLEREAWRDVLVGRGSHRLSATVFRELLREAEQARQEADDAAQPAGPRPERDVNVTGPTPWRYATGEGEGYPRAVYQRVRDEHGELSWRHRADLPYVHARIVRRDGAGTRIGTDYLVSADVDGPRVIVTDADLNTGEWSLKAGMQLSSDRDIREAAGTAIRDAAYRDAPLRDAVPALEPSPETDRLELPPGECLPDGYLAQPAGGADREALADMVTLAAAQPGGKLALILGASAAAPYLGALNTSASFWLDLYGETTQGKTTAQHVAAALWGDPRTGIGIVTPWNASAIGTGRLLGMLGILPAFLTERGGIERSRSEWANLIYSTAEGNTRTTAERVGHGIRKSVPWFGILFSSGNGRLTDGITAGSNAGIPRRVLELPTPITAGLEDGQRLENLARLAYGWAGPEILERYTVSDMRALHDAGAHAVGRPESEGLASMTAWQLALIVAGAMALDDVAGTGDTLTNVTIEAAREYLAENGHSPEHDADRMLDALAESVAFHRSAWPTLTEYIAADQVTTDPATMPYRGVDRSVAGVRDLSKGRLYVRPDALRELADSLGVDLANVCRELYARGTLQVRESWARRKKWQDETRAVPGRPRVYNLELAALETDDDSEGEGDDGPGGPELPPEPPAPDPPADDTGPAASKPHSDAQRQERPGTRPRAASRKDGQARALESARRAIDEGRGPRLLAALEGPYAPQRGKRGPYWRPPVPGIAYGAHVPSGYTWHRPYVGPVAVLDRSGAWIAGASSVPVAHGQLEHTGEADFTGRPGYYLIERHPWHGGDDMPDPLGGIRLEQVWVTAPTVALLVDLEREGRWADVTIVDSYTGDPARLSEWTGYVNEIRRYAIENYGRGEQYDAVKVAFSQAVSLMLGSEREDGSRKWKCQAARPDWRHAIQAQTVAMQWRYADDMRKVAPDHAPVALRNVDEIVIPAPALEVVTTTDRPGGRSPIRIDPDGITLGTFKVKGYEEWGSGE